MNQFVDYEMFIYHFITLWYQFHILQYPFLRKILALYRYFLNCHCRCNVLVPRFINVADTKSYWDEKFYLRTT